MRNDTAITRHRLESARRMGRTWTWAFASAAILSVSAASAQHEVTAPQVVTALEGAYGVHQGQRRNHTKGLCAAGTFVGTPEGAGYSRSALFSGATIPVIVRFSLAGGNPEVSDAEKIPRGMALEFRLADGGLQHMTMINTPMFFAQMPRTFLDKMLALKPDPATGNANPEAIKPSPQVTRTMRDRRNSSPITIHRRAMPTAPISAFIRSGSSTRPTRSRWSNGASFRRAARRSSHLRA